MNALAAAAPGALMFAEASDAHRALRAQLAEARFADHGRRKRARAPRAVATCARGSSDHAATFAKYLI
jgi:glucosamine--fructose-6-phosphate aminotransferase (isomerizing)